MPREQWVRVTLANGRLQVASNVDPLTAIGLLASGSTQIVANASKPETIEQKEGDAPIADAPARGLEVRQVA